MYFHTCYASLRISLIYIHVRRPSREQCITVMTRKKKEKIDMIKRRNKDMREKRLHLDTHVHMYVQVHNRRLCTSAFSRTLSKHVTC